MHRAAVWAERYYRLIGLCEELKFRQIFSCTRGVRHLLKLLGTRWHRHIWLIEGSAYNTGNGSSTC